MRCFFHSALVHSSPPNRGGETRVAIQLLLHPKTHPFCHFYQGPETGNEHVEMYSVTPDFYYSEDFESRPDPAKYPLLETMPLFRASTLTSLITYFQNPLEYVYAH